MLFLTLNIRGLGKASRTRALSYLLTATSP